MRLFVSLNIFYKFISVNIVLHKTFYNFYSKDKKKHNVGQGLYY
jgi:hypothetical protein